MKLPMVLLSFVLLSALIEGCSSAKSANSTSNPTPITSASPMISGNWTFEATSSVVLNSTVLGGNLTTSGTNVTGNLFIIPLPLFASSNSSCYLQLDNVPVTGTIDSKGKVVIVSAAVRNQVITATGSLSKDNSTFQGGTYSISSTKAGMGCADGDKGTITGSLMQPLAGSFSGRIATGDGSVGTQPNTTVEIKQSEITDALGYFEESGTLQLTGSPCFSAATLNPGAGNTAVLGTLFYAVLTANDKSSSQLTVIGQFDPQADTIELFGYSIAGGICDGVSSSDGLLGIGTLTL